MNTKTFTITNIDGSATEMVEIDNGNDSFTQMTKATYEATLAANSAPTAQQGVGQKLGTTVSTSVDSRPLDGNAGQSDPPPASAYRSPAP